MADLGTIPAVVSTKGNRPSPLTPITDYNINRGRPLGPVTVVEIVHPLPVLISPLANYIVRQTRILFRQLWPGYGQRFPQ